MGFLLGAGCVPRDAAEVAPRLLQPDVRRLTDRYGSATELFPRIIVAGALHRARHRQQRLRMPYERLTQVNAKLYAIAKAQSDKNCPTFVSGPTDAGVR